MEDRMNELKVILGVSIPFAVIFAVIWFMTAGNVQAIHHLNTGISVVWWKSGGNTTYATADIQLFNLVFICACLIMIAGTLALISEALSARSDNSDAINYQANLMREIARHQDAHTSMMKSEIDRTRAHGEYRERPDIAEHEQRLRELRSRLR
jgi:hypothetical protein